MTNDLDSHLHQMGGALRRSAGAPPPRRTPTPGRTRLLVGVPLVAVAALGAGLSVRGGDGPDDVTASPVVNLRGLIPETTPDGLDLSWAGQQAAGVTSTSEGDVAAGGALGDLAAGPVDLSTYVYGDASIGTPFAAEDLVVNVWEAVPGAPMFDAPALAAGLPGSAVATVQGTEALVCDVAICATDAVPAVSSVRWQAADGVQTVAASQSLTVDELLRIADDLVVDGTTVDLRAIPDTVDGALDEVAHIEGTVIDGARQVDAYWLGYVDAADPTRALDVTTLTGSADDMTALVWSLGATELVDLRGVDAYLAVDEAGDAVELVWQEADGVLAHVTALGMTRDEVVAVAESLRWVADDEWQEVEELAAAAQAAVGDVTAGADVSGDSDGTDADAGVAAGGTDVDASAGADVTEGGVDVEVGLDTTITDLETSLHVDLGAAAVVGPVVDTVEDGIEDLAEHLPPPPTAPAPTAPGLLP